MTSLIEAKVYLIQKYLNKDYTLFDTTVKSVTSHKQEYPFIDELLMQGLEKSLEMYEPLLLMGTTKEIQVKILLYKDTFKKSKKENNRYLNKKKIKAFVKDYNIDLKEIDNISLKLMSDDFMSISLHKVA